MMAETTIAGTNKKESTGTIVDTNQKMFEVFRKKLKIPKQKHYEQAAQKLAEWLGNERAYYPQARREIVDLLQTARESLSEWVGLADHRDLYPLLADAYIQLILSVEPFRERFVEPELQEAIHKLITSVASVQTSSPAAPQNPPSDPIHATPLVSPTAIDPSQQMRPSSSSLTSALTPTASSPIRTSTVPPPVKENTDNAINPSISATQPQSIVPGVTTSASAPATGSASVPVVKPKRKKKKKEDFSKLLQADVQLYNQKRGTVAKAVEVAHPTPVDVDIPKAGPVPPISSESVPITVEKEKPNGVDSVDLISEKPPPVSPQESHLNQPEDVEMPESHPQDTLDVSNSGSVAPPEALTSAMDEEVNRVLRTLTGPGHPDPTMPDVAISDVPAMNSDEAMPLASDVDLPTVRDPLTTLEAVFSSDTSSMEGIVDTSHPDHPAAFQAIFETMVNKVNKLIASSTDTSVPAPSLPSQLLPTPPTSDERSPRPEGAESLPSEEDIIPSSKTGIETATVIARHQGLAAGTISIDFFINQTQFDSITKWNDRSKHHDDIGESLCITLLCFSAADLRARLEASKSRDLRSIIPDLECSWPKTGGLSVNALWKGQRIDFPMSPPFALPLNGLIDLSPFLVLGQNTFRITQTRDMSNYWLILCAHYPTPAQVNAVVRRRHKERDWTGWLEKISRPLQLPFKIPVEV